MVLNILPGHNIRLWTASAPSTRTELLNNEIFGGFVIVESQCITDNQEFF